MKKTFFMFILPAALLALVFYYSGARHGKTASGLELPSLQSAQSKIPSSDSKVSASAVEARKKAEKERFQKLSAKDMEKLQSSTRGYFKKLIRDPGFAKLYADTKRFYGDSASGDGAARWITLGMKFDSRSSYGDTLSIALYDANQEPESVLASVKAHLSEIRENPLVYEMTQNLVAQLDLPVQAKAQFYADEFTFQMAKGKTDDSFWVSTLGIYLAQQSGVSAEEMASSLRGAFSSSKLDPRLNRELRTMVESYYPGINL